MVQSYGDLSITPPVQNHSLFPLAGCVAIDVVDNEAVAIDSDQPDFRFIFTAKRII